MNRAEFMKTFGLGVATATVAPKVLFNKEKKQKKFEVDMQPPHKYVKHFDRDQIIVFENAQGELELGRYMGGTLLHIDPCKRYQAVEKINVGNFKPQLLYSAVEQT